MSLPTTNLRTWYDASDLSTITKDGGNLISQWRDKSGNAYHLNQTAAADKPLHEASIMDEHYGVLFDGVSDSIYNLSVSHSGNPITMAAVIIPRRLQASATNVETIAATKGIGVSNGVMINVGNGYAHTEYNFLDSEYSNGVSVIHPSSNYLDGMAVRAYYRITLLDAYFVMATFPAATDGGKLLLGCTGGFTDYGNFSLMEFMTWDKTLDATERARVFSYFQLNYNFGQNVIHQISSNAADTEETYSTGAMDSGGSILQMNHAFGVREWVGYHFTNVQLPYRARIRLNHAYLRFISYDTMTGTSPNLTIWGEAADDATQWTSSAFNVSGRTRTTASVSWTGLGTWNTDREYISASISTIIQEIINRPGWNIGNSINIIVGGDASGFGRDAKAYDYLAADAAYLYIEYERAITPIITDGSEGGIIARSCLYGNALQ